MSNPRKNDESTLGQVFTLFSTASATGKTVLAINFAADLAERGYKVCVADMDNQFGDVGSYLKLEDERSLFKVYEDENVNAADLVVETEWNFDVLLSPKELDEAYQIDKEIIKKALQELRANYDYVVVDTTTGFSDMNLSILEYADVLFMPCVVDFIPSIKNLKLGIETLQRLQFESGRIRLVLNRNNSQTQISTSDVEVLLGREFQYFVDNDYKGMMQSIKEAKPIVLSDERSKIADDISAVIASELGEKADAEDNSIGGWFSSLWK